VSASRARVELYTKLLSPLLYSALLSGRNHEIKDTLHCSSMAEESGSAPLVPLLPSKFYWYDCDGAGDGGWGCGYRCLQTLESCIVPPSEVPSLHEVISALGEAEGHYADVGDIVLYFIQKYGWTSQMLQVRIACVVISSVCVLIYHHVSLLHTGGRAYGGRRISV
jgi:hypothetical protein